jgi:GT2 family glycosyltransferase
MSKTRSVMSAVFRSLLWFDSRTLAGRFRRRHMSRRMHTNFSSVQRIKIRTEAETKPVASNSRFLASILIPNYQGADCILECVKSVLKASGEDIEIIVVDNASPDKSAEIVRNLRSVKLIQLMSNVGYGEACNIGARNSSGDYLIFLNNDTAVREGWLSELLSCLKDQSNGAVCSKVTLPTGPETIDSCGGVSDIYGFAWSRGNGEIDRGQYDSSPSCFYAVGSSLAVRKDIFQAVGGFDKELFMYLEDIDLSWRLRRLGLDIRCVSGSKVLHRSGISRMRTSDIQYLFNRNRLRMILKNYSLRSLLGILPRYIVLQVGLVIWVMARLRGDELRTILAAWLWNARHLRDTVRTRRDVQTRRLVDDSSITKHMIKKPAGVLFLLGLIRSPVLQRKFR